MPWARSGMTYSRTHPDAAPLPVGVYSVDYSPMSGFYLTWTAERFDLPSKLYALEVGFVERVLDAYSRSNASIGVLLSGLKGAGKTVVAKQICNGSGLPALVVTKPYPGIESFLQELDCPTVIFFDEFEKVFGVSGIDGISTEGTEMASAALLALMDGASLSQPHLFLLTVNERTISSSLLDRPSRVRYAIEFADLSADVVTEIVDDLLVDRAHRDAVLEWLSRRILLSIDAVVSVIQEVNWFGFDEAVFSRWFNLAERPPSRIEFYRRGTNVYLGFTTPEMLAMEHGPYGFDIGNMRIVDGRYVGTRVMKVDTKRKRAVVCRYGHSHSVDGSMVDAPTAVERDASVDEEMGEQITAQGLIVLGLYDCEYEVVRQQHDSFGR